MKSPQKRLLGAAMATTVAGVLAFSGQAPSFTQAGTESTKPPTVAKDASGRADAVAAARDYVADRGSLFKKSKDDGFVRAGVQQGTAGTWYVAYERTYRGLPVVGGDFVVAINKAGKVTGRSTGQERTIALASVKPAVGAPAARTEARSELKKTSKTSTPELVVYAEGAPRLAYETVVTGTKAGIPSKLHVYTDATSGETISSWDEVVAGTGTGYYNGNVSFGTSGSRLVVLDDRHLALRPEVRRPERRGVHRHGQRLGQRHRHQPRDRLRRRDVRHEQGVGHARRPGSAAAASRATAPATRRWSG